MTTNSRRAVSVVPEACHFLAHDFAILGEKEAALKSLEIAVDLGLISHPPPVAEKDPFLETLRGEERF